MNDTQPTPADHHPNYKPGDIVNGWQLDDAGTEWNEIGPDASIGGPPRPRPPKKSHTTRNVFLVIGVVIFLLFAGCTALVAVVGSNVDENTGTTTPGSVSQGLGANDATADVVLGVTEAPDAIGVTYLPVTVTNHSAKRSDYYITIAADNADGSRLGTSPVLVLGLEPGQTATSEKAMFTGELPADVVFKVLEVQRTASV